MNTNKSVGENCPPCETAPKTENEMPMAAQGGPLPADGPPLATQADWEAYYKRVAAKNPRAPFTATRADGLFAIACFFLGFLGVRWVLGTLWQGVGVTAFCALYAGAVLVYARAKGVKPAPSSWYWLAILQLCGLSFALWPAGLLAPWQILLCLGAAVYWCGCLFGLPLAGKTGNYLALDAVNLLFVVPLQNLGCSVSSLGALGKGGGGEGRRAFARRVLPVLAGLLLCIPLLAVVLPLLATADSTFFGQFLDDLYAFFADFQVWRLFREEWAIILMQMAVGVPAAVWLFGLVAGGAHKRYTRCLDLRSAQQTMHAARVAPATTVRIVLGVACLTYLAFIACQLPYFFSAFAGAKPQQYAVYSEYARQGFFELCRIAAINLGLLALADSFCRLTGENKRAPGLRFLNILLSALTLLVIATAFSKMGLYIVRHGLTPKRIMTCVFMVFLAGLCVAVMAVQYKKFSVVRFAAVFGAGLLCALCLCNLNGLVARYNTAAWKSGALPLDELILARCGPAAAGDAMAVYNSLDDSADNDQKQRLSWALYHMLGQARATQGHSADNLANQRARQIIRLPQLEGKPQGLTKHQAGRWDEMSADEREWLQMEQARLLFESHYAEQLERGGYE